MTKLCTKYEPQSFQGVKNRDYQVYAGRHPITKEEHFLETEQSGITHMIVDSHGKCKAECISVGDVLTDYLSLEAMTGVTLFVIPLTDITEEVKKC